MTDKQARSPGNAETTPPDLGASVAGVVDAVLEVGVSLARVMAQATASGGVVEPLPPSTPAFQAIVGYGVTAVGNVASALMSSGEVLRKAGKGTTPTSAAKPARGGSPTVNAGSTLRVPLSVENPGEQPMRDLSPRVRAVRRAAGTDATSVIEPASIRFEPALFDVAPRDFEKLTVFVPVPDDTPPGNYQVVLALGAEEPDLTIAFAVVPQQQ
jgi:hypothetical protein